MSGAFGMARWTKEEIRSHGPPRIDDLVSRVRSLRLPNECLVSGARSLAATGPQALPDTAT
jgi:hypothetical protein